MTQSGSPPGDAADIATPATAPYDNTTVLVKGPVAGTGPDDRVHYLVVTEGEGAGQRIELGAKPIVIGREPPADMVIPDTRISRKHCRVGMILEDVFVTDLGSSNGTYVDGQRITGNAFLPVGGRLRLGDRTLVHEWRARRDVQASKDLDHDLENASQYVRSLIPPPIASGPIRTEWMLLPSTRLGGDVFGYHNLDDDRFAIYLIDVSGHGTGPAMHAVSIANVIRGRAMPGVDPASPAQVAQYLNATFQMTSHGGLYFTMWYGVYDRRTRALAYCSAGHHQSLLVPAERNAAQSLRTPNIAMGVIPAARFAEASVEVAAGSSLYVFSDGVFEIEMRDGEQWTIEALTEAVVGPRAAGAETERLRDVARGVAKSPAFEDDFSMVVATFA
jgi:pSer/pThr/pTyr-binding forkhead associated (FHA) protein